MSLFSDVDGSGQVDTLLQYLDDTDRFMVAFKSYVVAAAGRYEPGGRVLDLGCGVGHDLVRLRAAGLTAVGLDPSAHALARADGPVVRGDGARLPFLEDDFDGCRIERVLQHVQDPGAVLDEVIRVVKPGGFLAVLEPDHTSLRVECADPWVLARSVTARHASIGAELADLLRERGCLIDDLVTETSFGYALDRIPVNAAAALERAGLSADERTAWLAEQQQRTESGTFAATWTKHLVVARAPGRHPGLGGRAAR